MSTEIEKILDRHKENSLRKIIIKALEEAYQSEVIDTNMKELTIGGDNEYATKEDWMWCRLQIWKDD